MYPNLEAELARRKIARALLAKKINKTKTTVSLKLNGKAPLTLAECIEIKNAIDPRLTIDYLFDTGEQTSKLAESIAQ